MPRQQQNLAVMSFVLRDLDMDKFVKHKFEKTQLKFLFPFFVRKKKCFFKGLFE